jgi:hypothetical protein
MSDAQLFLQAQLVLHREHSLPQLCKLFLASNHTLQRKQYVTTMKTNNARLHVKCLLFLSNFNQNQKVLINFHKNITNKISWKTVEWELSYFMQFDRQIQTENRHEEASSHCLQQICKYTQKYSVQPAGLYICTVGSWLGRSLIFPYPQLYLYNNW